MERSGHLIFLRNENWRSYLRYYPVTCLILLANVVMHLIVFWNGGSQDNRVLLRFGALLNMPPYSEELWRNVTSMFLHSGFDHLFFNCFAILIFAPPLERWLGPSRYLLLYLLSGIVGNVLSTAYYNSISQPTLSVGASGAIYGIYGAFLYISLLQRQIIDEASRKTLYVLLIMGVILSFTRTEVSWMGHLGGLLGGFFIYGLIIRLLKLPRQNKS